MLTVLSGDLGPTATYSRRSFAWISNGSGEVDMPDGEIIPAIGKLTLKLQHGKGRGLKCELDTYAVAEAEPEELGTRLFVLLNLTDPTQEKAYLVTVGGVNKCRCIAGLVGHYQCKHEAALSLLVADGILEPADELLTI